MDLNNLRTRIIQGGEYTTEELRLAVEQLRTNRVEAATRSTKKRTEKKGASDAELDAGLKDLGLNI